jgi:hypothetical protein
MRVPTREPGGAFRMQGRNRTLLPALAWHTAGCPGCGEAGRLCAVEWGRRIKER